MNIADDILKTIGNTPMVRINKLNPNINAGIYAKLEGFNPSGSIKDRIALSMIQQAEVEGKLVKGKTIIEPTSGNTGVALAMIGVIKGYDVEIVMSEAVSTERAQMIKAFGAKVTLTEGKLGTDGAIRRAIQLVKENSDKYFMPDQFSNEYNKIAHYRTTGDEIWRQTDGNIDYFVSSLGTSGTIMGVGKVLKEHNPQIKIVSAHPVKGHYIQGLKNMEEAIVPSIYDPSKIDITIMVDTRCLSRYLSHKVMLPGLMFVFYRHQLAGLAKHPQLAPSCGCCHSSVADGEPWPLRTQAGEQPGCRALAHRAAGRG